MTVSIVSLVHEPPGRIELLLEPFRELDHEVVLAIDDRVPPAWIDGYRRLADRVFVVPYPGAFAYMYAWLAGECRGDWILHIDDDEVPSIGLPGAVGDAIAGDDITHAWIGRRWLWPDGGSYLTQWPWRSDWHPRLLRNDPNVLTVPGQPHELHPPGGRHRFLAAPVWHAQLVTRSYDERVEIGRQRERDRPGSLIGERSVNVALYLPEDSQLPVTVGRLGGDDATRVERYLQAGEKLSRPRRRRGSVQQYDADQLASVTRSGSLDPGVYRARIEALHDGAFEAEAGARFGIDVEVMNLGHETWPGGRAGNPMIRLAARWLDEAGAPRPTGERTYFGAPVVPGATALVPIYVDAPTSPGRYRIEIDLVHDPVAWFKAPLVVDVVAT